jgi:hypothetical protein
MYADVREHDEEVEILVDTHGRRLLTGSVVAGNGQTIAAKKVVYPVFQPDLIGGMSGWDDPRYGADIAEGPTVLHFGRKDIGDRPWRVKLDVMGVGRVEIVVGG